ncbi:putative bifunctional diguanylate cyclase/phosphodiesterase [Polymorphobacter sp.]|uniref:putative bifunctional diguanylate cyclase/phosphodiesterase n=1 Tax=Polymorphobacter sp. TaxID=1909290 RepID=UPI003F6E9940
MTQTLIVAAPLSIGLAIWSHYILHNANEAGAYVALFAVLCTISCAACLSSLPLAAYIVIVIGTIPVSISLLTSGDTMLASMGANILLIAPLIVGLIHRQHQQLRRLVESRSFIAAEQLRVSELAYSDSLTGLANRRAFLDELEIASSARPGLIRAVGILDLDGFKLINDSYGHQTGDALLVETAKRFQQLDIGDAMIARLGGDEFAVLLRNADRLEDARQRMALLGGVFDRPFVVHGKTFRLRASTGMAIDVADTATTMALINRADLAMYEAKRAHSGAIALFEPLMEARNRRRVMIEQALAIPDESKLIELFYQPIFDPGTHEIVAFEALARWTHPTLGVISPAEFIPLAEQSGMSQPITIQLLAIALEAAAHWPPSIALSFNLSGADLNSPLLPNCILEMVRERAFDPGRLWIEVTETALLSDFATARSALSLLQAGNIRIQLDDFGAGYASIGYLRELQFDGIKLDGSLIALATESRSALELLEGVLQLCRAIGTPVTAEMVESAAQHDLLCSLGVEKLQGFYLSRPLTAAQALQACLATPMRPPSGDPSRAAA